MNRDELLSRITINPKVCFGNPAFVATRSGFRRCQSFRVEEWEPGKFAVACDVVQ
jgi:hypothetical protein